MENNSLLQQNNIEFVKEFTQPMKKFPYLSQGQHGIKQGHGHICGQMPNFYLACNGTLNLVEPWKVFLMDKIYNIWDQKYR